MAGTWSAAERALAVPGLTSRSSFVEIESSGPDLQRWLLELLTLARGRISDEPGDDEASRTLQEIESAFEVVTTLDGDGHPFRVVTSLKDGQSTTFSIPGAVGEKSTVVEVKREGQRLLVTDGASDRRAELTPRVRVAD